ncbi:MAG: hypothetical protein IT495_01295 [Gammaproteobacteria bacterium]|nr:hypothetical protein [Gammaproteobacteria bacterium]
MCIFPLSGFSGLSYECIGLHYLKLLLGRTACALTLVLAIFMGGMAIGAWFASRRTHAWSRLLPADAVVEGVIGLTAPGFHPSFIALVDLLHVHLIPALGAPLAVDAAKLFGQSFTAMQWLLGALPRSEHGYTVFLLASHALALAIMLPATFCAGMTLPLITYVLLARGAGERSIGVMYGANTVGAIAGVMFMTHVGMPLPGLRNAVTAGAAIDLALGLGLLATARGGARVPRCSRRPRAGPHRTCSGWRSSCSRPRTPASKPSATATCWPPPCWRRWAATIRPPRWPPGNAMARHAGA